ncbi:Photosystem I chlorophyll a apoprotein A2 [compost metagenome]
MQNPTIAIEIQGHTDNTGDDKMNEKLSANRAKAVYEYLLKENIPAKRLSYKGFGAAKPRTDNGSEEAKQQNRRTEFIITKL